MDFSIRFTGKKIQRVEHSTSKCRPNSSVPQNNVAHGGFVLGKQRVKEQSKFFHKMLIEGIVLKKTLNDLQGGLTKIMLRYFHKTYCESI